MAEKANFLIFGLLIVIWTHFSFIKATLSPVRWGCPLPKRPTAKDCGGKKGPIKCQEIKDCLEISQTSFCCGTNCGGSACVEVTKRPGECPVKPLGVASCPGINPVYKCGVDDDCKDKKQKCCFDGCIGTDCFDIKTVLPEKHKFNCPLPPRKPPKKCTLAGDECIKDSDCPNGQTCCKHPCGHNYCFKPSRPKRGECPLPNVKSSLCTEKDKMVKCGVDDDCRKTLKCCSSVCGGTICRSPCVDNRNWKGTVQSENNKCVKCTCSKLKRVGVLMARACTNNWAKVREGCCKSCQEFAPFVVK